MNPLSNVFIKMGDTGLAKHFAQTNTTGDWQSFTVDLNPPYDPEPFPANAVIRYIITPSDRYTSAVNPDRAFPVGGIDWKTNTATGKFIITARNSDTAAGGGQASFFWLAIAENVSRSPGSKGSMGPVASIPLNQTFLGQPANFAATQTTGDHQVLPNFFCPAEAYLPPALQFAQNGPYSFQQTVGTVSSQTFGTAAFPAPPSPNRPLVFATANNIGCGVSPYLPTHNAAAVALVADTVTQSIGPNGFNLIARNSDAAGSCGFNWVALQLLFGGRAPSPPNLMVDTGHFGAGNVQINFNQAGTQGDWFSGEIQFSAPFSTEPVVLITPFFPQPYFPDPPQTNNSSCAPVGIVQNVSRFGFTLAAHNTDTNNTGGNASFYWVAFGPSI